MKKMNGEKKSIKKLAKSARNFKSQKASWRKLSLVLCDDPEGWNGEVGSEVQERGDICIHMADSRCCTTETNTL